MKGAINYLRQVRLICTTYNGNCKSCPLGNKQYVQDCNCPRLNVPCTWSDDKILTMIKV